MFLQFKFLAENQTEYSLKALQTDNAKEFLSLTKILNMDGISHRLTCPHTHDHNGSVDAGLALLDAASLSFRFWGEAFSYVVFSINILPTAVLHNLSPYEKLFPRKPDYAFLKIFGCGCYPLLRPYNKHKFDFRSSLCLFLGYDSHRKGYLCLTESGKFIVSRHVLFNEFIFPYSMPKNSFQLYDNIYVEPPTSPSPLTVVSLPLSTTPPDNSAESSPLLSTATPSPSTASTSSSPSSTPVVSPYFNVHPMFTRAKDDIYKPKAFQSSVHVDSFEPSTHRQAMLHSHWLQAMKDEYDALMQNSTWTLTPLPPTANVVG